LYWLAVKSQTSINSYLRQLKISLKCSTVPVNKTRSLHARYLKLQALSCDHSLLGTKYPECEFTSEFRSDFVKTVKSPYFHAACSLLADHLIKLFSISNNYGAMDSLH
jgi:hypothetical protein